MKTIKLTLCKTHMETEKNQRKVVKMGKNQRKTSQRGGSDQKRDEEGFGVSVATKGKILEEGRTLLMIW
jgi:hypothetical protein